MTDSPDFPCIKVTLSPQVLTLDFEVGDGPQGVIDIFEPHMDKWRRILGISQELTGNDPIVTSVDVTDDLIATISATGATSAEPDKPRRGRKSKTVEAVAPPPIPVPTQEAPPPAPPAPVDTGIPAFLDRTVAVAPPPPMVAPPVPVAPASPPIGVLAAKVAAEVKRRGEGAADQGAGLVDWLAKAGLCVPGATFQEAVDCVSFLSDEKLGPVANALGVA